MVIIALIGVGALKNANEGAAGALVEQQRDQEAMQASHSFDTVERLYLLHIVRPDSPLIAQIGSAEQLALRDLRALRDSALTGEVREVWAEAADDLDALVPLLQSALQRSTVDDDVLNRSVQTEAAIARAIDV